MHANHQWEEMPITCRKRGGTWAAAHSSVCFRSRRQQTEWLVGSRALTGYA